MTTNSHDPSPTPDQTLRTQLNLNNSPATFKHVFTWILVGLAIIGLIYIATMWIDGDSIHSVRYKTVELKQGSLNVSVSATGTLEPLNKVDVGSEISGTIKKVLVDFNDEVVQGQILAVLDTDQLQANVNKAAASLTLAKAKVEEANATLMETKQKFERLQTLADKGLCTQDDCDSARAAYARAQASLTSAKAQVVQARASLDAEKTRLDKATIYSPINGIVLKRNVEPGQTVAASLQTPVLFTLAENLTQMELQVDVDEADIGQVNVNQEAIFTVDAFPHDNFPAKTTEVHLAPQTVEGVVTYKTILNVDNSNLLLRPGMTATADIYVKRVENVLLIPNAALRFMPSVAEKTTATQGGSLLSKIMPRPPHRRKTNAESKLSTQSREQTIWTVEDGNLSSVSVMIGATDGIYTEAVSGNIKPGMFVVVDTIKVEN